MKSDDVSQAHNSAVSGLSRSAAKELPVPIRIVTHSQDRLRAIQDLLGREYSSVLPFVKSPRITRRENWLPFTQGGREVGLPRIPMVVVRPNALQNWK
ncbi:hypothetical protein ETAA8_32610 [Anatilimnocola aggregata]|uniref:Uncharacterized protein n=1 Tax=Anatilimnocola aggregata TaxID=2528021 RepID=A0A517YD46_9BACT|nr:hypothetical protein ETAA8_32610 [Anatilimnocola aggregata]